jgi:hypothetical protein
VTDGTWITIGNSGAPAFQNGWTNYGSGYASAAYMRRNGIVYLKGPVKTGTLNAVLFTLPCGYRAAEARIFPGVNAIGTFAGRLTLLTHGTLKQEGGTSNQCPSGNLRLPSDSGRRGDCMTRNR